VGKTLLILLVGFSASFGILADSKNRRYIESVDRTVKQFTSYSAKNAAASGAYMALNRLYLTPTWRTGYSNLTLAGNALNVTIEDQNADASLGPYQLRIRSSGGSGSNTNLNQVLIFDRGFQNFAVWAKDTVISMSTTDSLGANNPNLLIQNAPFMPKIDKAGLKTTASGQTAPNHYYADNFQPSDGYPNGSFYYLPGVVNVTYVRGNLRVKDEYTIYGIYVVEGNVTIEGGATLNGIIYQPNSTSVLRYSNAGDHDASPILIKGGVVTWGTIDGSGGNFSVQHFPSYLRTFVNAYAPDNPPLRVLSWK
jgi:hypothetical protein